jgi:hypothetical protein
MKDDEIQKIVNSGRDQQGQEEIIKGTEREVANESVKIKNRDFGDPLEANNGFINQDGDPEEE